MGKSLKYCWVKAQQLLYLITYGRVYKKSILKKLTNLLETIGGMCYP